MLRLIASLGEPFYYAGSAWKNRSFGRNPAKAIRVGVPVISIGNVTVGGTGKTPMVEWVVRQLLDGGKRPTIISRGYGAKAGEANDEARELAQKLPDVPHIQNPDRVAAAREAIERLDCDCLVLDDAFQHRRIARDLDLVLLDATEPFGYGHLLPRGLLRESLAGLRRADAVILTRADACDNEARDEIWRTVEKYLPQAVRIEAAHAPANLLAADGTRLPLDELHGQRIAAFCGIGNPAAFRATLEECGAEIVDFLAFPDHCTYDENYIAALTKWIDGLTDVDHLICTHKDLVKVSRETIGNALLFALTIGMDFRCGESELAGMVQRAVE